ncbi:MAG: E2/UBC family protein [Methylobacter sp.]
MALLTEEDYSDLERMQLKFKEDDANRLLVFIDFDLVTGLYQVDRCNALVIIPPTYPAAGNDMFWTYPRLQRTDGLIIPGTIDPALPDCQRDIRVFEEKTYDRWSRHWQVGNQIWRAGRDNITTIVNRLTYVLANSHEG